MGGVRRGKVPGGRLLSLPRPPKPWVHDPVELGWLTVTAVATMVPLLEEPVAVTQSPTATAEAGTLTVWLNRVEAVQLTVTCPCCWFWTSIDCPVMAATEPEAPGNDATAPGVRPGPRSPGRAGTGGGRRGVAAEIGAGVAGAAAGRQDSGQGHGGRGHDHAGRSKG